jgi:hypothetical protein
MKRFIILCNKRGIITKIAYFRDVTKHLSVNIYISKQALKGKWSEKPLKLPFGAFL